jgi:hypothetical protein
VPHSATGQVSSCPRSSLQFLDIISVNGVYQKSDGTPIRLLVADDSELIRRTVCVLLHAQTGIAVSGEAGNYAELLKIFNPTTTDVLLMDMRTPGDKLFTPATIKGHFHVACLLAMSVVERRRDCQPCSELWRSETLGQEPVCFSSNSCRRRMYAQRESPKIKCALIHEGGYCIPRYGWEPLFRLLRCPTGCSDVRTVRVTSSTARSNWQRLRKRTATLSASFKGPSLAK